MTYRELQIALRTLREQGFTSIRLNSKKEVLQAEYDSIVQPSEPLEPTLEEDFIDCSDIDFEDCLYEDVEPSPEVLAELERVKSIARLERLFRGEPQHHWCGYIPKSMLLNPTVIYALEACPDIVLMERYDPLHPKYDPSQPLCPMYVPDDE